MRIHSMTATFGKLEHQTLVLKPGLNVIHAPNEWGKSTWCAFLAAMLYGIDTRERTTQAALADKEHYKPWSGSQMSGRIELSWKGRDITIERHTKGRVLMGEFSAYETGTGLPVAELTAANCGEMLLGVEKSVFTRSAFVRLTDLPVTDDEALRRRLNALVTTGDESGASDALAQKLKELKNSCRHNKTGLLPQAEAQRDSLQGKLSELERLQSQTQTLLEEQQALEHQRQALENHQAALDYQANQVYAQKLAAAQVAAQTAAAQVTALEADCAPLPPVSQLEQSLQALQQLRSDLDTVHTQAQLLPQPPQKPEVPPYFQGLPYQDGVRMAETDARVYREALEEKRAIGPTVFAIGIVAASLLLLLIPHWSGILCAAIGVLGGLALGVMNSTSRRRAANTAHALETKYRPLPAEQWAFAAGQWAADQENYLREQTSYETKKAELDSRLTALNAKSQVLTQGQSIALCEQQLTEFRRKLSQLEAAKKELDRANTLVHALEGSCKQVTPPAAPDTLTLTPEETAQALQSCTYRLPLVHQRIGQNQGQMEALGHADVLRRELTLVTERISRLEDTYNALDIAQKTLTLAANELQRRFAPKLAKLAQAFFDQLTGGRYTRLILGQDLSVSAGTQDEDTLRSGLWRSDGTLDQLYLALRLAVAQELTPEAPLVLDDALVRFDDKRMALALDILQETAEEKQVLLFTCQGREQAYLSQK